MGDVELTGSGKRGPPLMSLISVDARRDRDAPRVAPSEFRFRWRLRLLWGAPESPEPFIARSLRTRTDKRLR